MYSLISPADGLTLARAERLSIAAINLDALQDRLVEAPAKAIVVNGLLKNAAAYCLRDMYLELADGQQVSHEAVNAGYDELCVLAGTVLSQLRLDDYHRVPKLHQQLGLYSEIGVLTTILGGIAEEYLPPGYAALATNRHYQGGLRKDVDIRARLGKTTFNIQVKTSARDENWVYESGIRILAAMSLARAVAPRTPTITPLFNAHSHKSPARTEAYEVVKQRLGIK